MKAYKELSKEMGHTTLRERELEPMRYEPGGQETSLAGKMRTRPKHSHKHSALGGVPGVSRGASTHTDYTCGS